MTQSKQEAAERNAKIRAEKLRENLARRKQQLRQRAAETPPDIDNGSDKNVRNLGEKPVG